MNLTTIAAAIAFATGLAVGSSGAWQLQTGRVASIKLELQNEKLDRANERIAIQRAARAAIERTTTAVSQAQADASNRLVALAADRDRAKSDLDRLRDTSAAAVRNASAGLDACTSTLTAFNFVFGQCSTALSEMAAGADQWVGQALIFQDAWPKE